MPGTRQGSAGSKLDFPGRDLDLPALDLTEASFGPRGCLDIPVSDLYFARTSFPEGSPPPLQATLRGEDPLVGSSGLYIDGDTSIAGVNQFIPGYTTCLATLLPELCGGLHSSGAR